MVEPAVIDVPLVGAEPTSGPAEQRPPTNWRRAIGISLVVGTVLGVGLSVVRIASDDDASPTSSTPTEATSTVITTPPTLVPLETLPPPAPARGATSDVVDSVAVTRPEYPEASGAGPAELMQYDIAGAIELLDRDLPRRSETHVEFGYGGFVMDLTIDRDPDLDRYRIVVESRGEITQVATVDIPGGTTYVTAGSDDVVEVLNADIIAGSTAVDANEYFDRLLLGPLRSDTFSEAATRGQGLVTIDGSGRAREFLTTIAGNLIPEWQLYAFGPVFEFRDEDRPDALEYAVYVTADGSIVQVDGVTLVGNVPQLIEHRLTELDEPLPIELPPPAIEVVPPPSTSAATSATTAATSP